MPGGDVLVFCMGTISHFPGRKSVDADAGGPVRLAGELIAMRHVDLDCVLETVRVLRTLDDQSYLDCYNRSDRSDRQPSAG